MINRTLQWAQPRPCAPRAWPIGATRRPAASSRDPAADAYILKHILHDWYDEDATRILQTIRRAAPLHARLLVIERLIGPPNEGAEAKSADLNMLVGPGGMERTREEFEALFSTGGWRLVAVHPAGSRYVIEGVLA